MHHPLRVGLVLAALSLPTPAWAQPATPTAAQTSAAQARFDRGRALFDQQNYPSALIEFREALSAYHSPNIRLYLGLCLAQTGHPAEGYTEVSQALNEAGDLSATDQRYAATRERARYELQQLESRVARITVRVPHAPDGTVVRVNGVEVGASAWGVAIPFDPGPVAVAAEASGYNPFQQNVQVAPGGTLSVEINLVAVPRRTQTATSAVQSATPQTQAGDPDAHETPRTVTVREGGGVRVAGYIVGALGLVGFGAFAAFGASASSRFETLQMDCNRGRCPASRVADIDAGQSAQTLANASLGVGIGLALVGTIMIAVGGPSDVQRPAAPERLSVWLDPSRGAVGVGGAF